MTEPTSEVSAQPETTRRGRPRPAATINRDEDVFRALTGQMTRTELVTATQQSPSAVYLSLHRLTRNGRVRRLRDGSQHRWERVGEPQLPSQPPQETAEAQPAELPVG